MPTIAFYKPAFEGGPVHANDILLRGEGYAFARWTGRGVIPPGINWLGTDEGLRFWGTPARLGGWEAEFEGPYPPNFFSLLTQGGSGDPPLRLDAGGVPEQLIVQAFTIYFSVAEQGGYTFGQVLQELAVNPSVSQTARRREWAGARCIGMRNLSAPLGESGVLPVGGLAVGSSLLDVAENLTAKINGSGVATAGLNGLVITITSLENGALPIAATANPQGGIAVAQVTPGSTSVKQVSTVTLSGAFRGGVTYAISLGAQVYDVKTEAKPKAGIWLYTDPLQTARGGRLLRNNDLTAEDYAASDWEFFGPPAIGRSLQGCLLTAGVAGSQALDGVRRKVAVSTVIPL